MFQLLKLLYYFLLSMIFSSVPLLRLHTQLKSLQLSRSSYIPENEMFLHLNTFSRTETQQSVAQLVGTVTDTFLGEFPGAFKEVMALEICNCITTRQRMLAIQYISLNRDMLKLHFFRVDFQFHVFDSVVTLVWLGLGTTNHSVRVRIRSWLRSP